MSQNSESPVEENDTGENVVRCNPLFLPDILGSTSAGTSAEQRTLSEKRKLLTDEEESDSNQENEWDESLKRKRRRKLNVRRPTRILYPDTSYFSTPTKRSGRPKRMLTSTESELSDSSDRKIPPRKRKCRVSSAITNARFRKRLSLSDTSLTHPRLAERYPGDHYDSTDNEYAVPVEPSTSAGGCSSFTIGRFKSEQLLSDSLATASRLAERYPGEHNDSTDKASTSNAEKGDMAIPPSKFYSEGSSSSSRPASTPGTPRPMDFDTNDDSGLSVQSRESISETEFTDWRVMKNILNSIRKDIVEEEKQKTEKMALDEKDDRTEK